MRKRIGEYRDLTAHLLESEAALYSDLLAAADRATKNTQPEAPFQTNVVRRFANWRIFASQGLVKF
jgi:hypothetical protein